MAKPSEPKANCRPTSPRPQDVSLVAITTAASIRATAVVGKMSAADRIAKYVQNTKWVQSSVCWH